MSLAQFDFYFVPRAEILKVFGALPKRLSAEDHAALKGWGAVQPTGDWAFAFDRVLGEIPAWDKNLRWWGSEVGDRIDVWTSAGQVRTIFFRIDVRLLNIKFIQTMVHFARVWDCVFLSCEGGQLVLPSRNHILQHIVDSTIVNERWDMLRGNYIDRDDGLGRLFLCHSSHDRDFVDRLAKDLRDNDIPVWYDQWELRVGDSLSDRIAEAIVGSAWVAIVLSPNSAASAWVKRELNAALEQELSIKEVFVLPLLLAHCELPAFLKDKVYADFRGSYEEGLISLLKRVQPRSGIV